MSSPDFSLIVTACKNRAVTAEQLLQAFLNHHKLGQLEHWCTSPCPVCATIERAPELLKGKQ